MKGSIRQQSKTSWQISIDLGKSPDGKRQRYYETFKGSRIGDARKRLTELLSNYDKGTFVTTPRKYTVADLLNRWLKDYVWPDLAPKTAEGYEHVCRRHLIPALGYIPLAQLKPEHIQHYYSEKLANGALDGKGALSPRTIRKHHITLHCALEHAVKWEMTYRNVADAVSTPQCQKAEIHTLDEDGLQRFLDAAESSPYYELFYLALFTGMRRSELLALRWTDINLLLCQVHITRTLHHLRNGETAIRPPKTAQGQRMVALSPSAAILLNEYKGKRARQFVELDRTLQEDDFVFSDVNGKPLLPDTVTHAWIKLVRRNGLNGTRLHDARHSHASLMLKQGVHPKIVSERLGHAGIQITLDTYSHVVPGLQEAAAKGFDDLLPPKRKIEANKSAF